jgi:muramidase (phage lysozyme)
MATLKCDPRLAAFLDLIAWSEGTSTSAHTHNDGYDVIVTGVDGAHTFTDYSCHPFALGRAPIVVRKAENRALMPADANGMVPAAAPRQVLPASYSTASGRYQIRLETWKEMAALAHLGTFSPQSQDAAALALLERRRASAHILSGNIEFAIAHCCLEWASFPGNLYDQGAHPLPVLLDNYQRLLAGQSA